MVAWWIPCRDVWLSSQAALERRLLSDAFQLNPCKICLSSFLHHAHRPIHISGQVTHFVSGVLPSWLAWFRAPSYGRCGQFQSWRGDRIYCSRCAHCWGSICEVPVLLKSVGRRPFAVPRKSLRWSKYVPMVHIGQVPKVHIFIERTKKPAQWRAMDSDRGG